MRRHSLRVVRFILETSSTPFLPRGAVLARCYRVVVCVHMSITSRSSTKTQTRSSTNSVKLQPTPITMTNAVMQETEPRHHNCSTAASTSLASRGLGLVGTTSSAAWNVELDVRSTLHPPRNTHPKIHAIFRHSLD